MLEQTITCTGTITKKSFLYQLHAGIRFLVLINISK